MSSLHQHTPSLTAVDPRGLTLRTVAYHRAHPQDESQSRIVRQTFGVTGQLHQQWDARLQRLHAADSTVMANQSLRHSLTGRVLLAKSIDAGWRVSLSGNAGQLLCVWDARGSRRRYLFDACLRPEAVFEQAADQAHEHCVERLTYAVVDAQHAARNQCGRLIRHDDPAGTVLLEQYALSGAMAQQIRSFLKPDTIADWPEPLHLREQLLERERYTSACHYDALGDLLKKTDAKGNRQLSQYGPAGELMQTVLVFKSGTRKVLLDQRIYNAQGQVESERAGNNVLTLATYAPQDGRLMRLKAHSAGSKKSVLQDLTYRYDRVGNVLSINDAAQPTTWANNTQIDPTSTFQYDTLYQLIKATGRESAQHNHGSAIPALMIFSSTDSSLMRNYTRHYQYDEGGNLVQMQHVPSSGQGFTQRTTIAARSNHSMLADLDTPLDPRQRFDQHGNLRALTRGQAMNWNVRNQLSRVTQVAREDGTNDDEVYGYDGSGLRVLKRRLSVAKHRQQVEEVRYLPGLELHRNYATGEYLNVLTLEAGHTRVRALIWEHKRPAGIDDEQLRFSLIDATSSSTLELDEQAALLSQEGYYPFGGTAWWAAKSQVEAKFKAVRYSGKERDATGLYYYGYRYYAPWLMRWINPDPAADVDSLNLYAMVANNPVTLTDTLGLSSALSIAVSISALILFSGAAAVLGASAGWAFGMPMAGAIVGASLGAARGVMVNYYRYQQEGWPPIDNDQLEYAALIAQQTIRLAQSSGLSREETNSLVNFVYSRLHQHADDGLLMTSDNSRTGEIYGHIGSASAILRQQRGDSSHVPTLRELRRLGFSSVLLRGPTLPTTTARAQPSTSSAQSGVSQFETQAAPSLVKRKAGRRGQQGPADEMTAQAVDMPAAPAAQFNIDESAIEHLMQRPEGRSIGITIGHLQEARYGAVHWHKHKDGLWSADLHGYPGTTRRGAYRLMLEHTGGRSYRVLGVRDPHRR
ncbi:RHS repeat-associated core domain-containing protein [Pseudomonas sp. SIMBA_077]